MNIPAFKEELSKRELSIEEVAKMAEVDKTTIYRIINGESKCTVSTAAKIVNALKLKPSVATNIFFENDVA